MFNTITGINESKTLKKHISCECKCRFDERKCNSYQWWNNDKCICDCKKRHVCEDYACSPATCRCENGKCLSSTMEDLAITCDEIIESYDEKTETFPTNFHEKKTTCKRKKIRNFILYFTCIIINYYSIIDIC